MDAERIVHVLDVWISHVERSLDETRTTPAPPGRAHAHDRETGMLTLIVVLAVLRAIREDRAASEDDLLREMSRSEEREAAV
jgi:hypothetical protein